MRTFLRWLPLVKGGLALLLSLTSASSILAQPASGSLTEAEKLFRAGKLIQAEPLFRQGLDSSQGNDRRLCYDRLLAIYFQVGRFDLGVNRGLEYRRWLEELGEVARQREVELDLGMSYYHLGHLRTAAGWLQRARQNGRLTATQQLLALQYLARCADRPEQAQLANQRWQEVEQLARRLLAAREVPPEQRINLTRPVVESLRRRGQFHAAVDLLTGLLPLYTRHKDVAGQRDTWVLLAELHLAVKDHPSTARAVREAQALNAKAPSPNQLLKADLTALLATSLRQQRQHAEARGLQDQAAALYLEVFRAAAEGKTEQESPLLAFWKLQQLHQDASQYQQALRLATLQAGGWGSGALLEARLQAEEGSLRFLVGSYGQAQKLLTRALQQLDDQQPANLAELPRVLNNLGIAELLTQNAERAEQLGQRCQQLYRDQGLAPDLLLAENWNLLGNSAAQLGKYAQAVDRYRAGLNLCAELGPAAGSIRSNLLLNLALLHKAQGDLEEALQACESAQREFEKEQEPNGLGLAAFQAARINIYLAQGQLQKAGALVPRILELCQQHGVKSGLLLLTARHCQALLHLTRQEVDRAQHLWQLVRAEQQREQQSLLLPRTLNYLALCAEVINQPGKAEQLYREAASLQQDNPRAFPVTHFITLSQLSQLLDRRGERSAARKLLEQALTVVERARLQTYGDARQRTGFFAQFAPAFDQLVEMCLRDRDLEGALAAATRGRSRSLLDQLQTAGVDPRQGLEKTLARQFLVREAELQQQLLALRAKVALVPTIDPEAAQTKQLLAAFDAAQHEYATVWREILNASPIFRNLGAQDSSQTAVTHLRDKLLGPKTLLLLYHVGKERSYVLLVGPRPRPIEVFALAVNEEIAQRIAPPAPVTLPEALANARGLVLRPRLQTTAPPPTPGNLPVVPLASRVASALVDHYRLHLGLVDFQPTRGLVLETRAPNKPLVPQRLELPGNVFVPPLLRERIQAAGADLLVIVPDGAMHRLPLEALLIETGARTRYLLDELPPVVYIPSISVLALLSERPAVERKERLSLLTVCDPAYPPPLLKPLPVGAPPLLAMQRQLVRLPGTAVESAAIRRLFAGAAITTLEGEQATEAALVRHLPGKNVIHLAAHGFADQRFSNLFGALALTPPEKVERADNDGFLTLNEIYTLPLKDCELAVLSACVTHVGPQAPLEAGVTLANGFLAAGARRVIASHWSVDDRSTAVFMERFFTELLAAERRGEVLLYARALQEARRHIRAQPRWSAPFYWAPFVLIGQPR